MEMESSRLGFSGRALIRHLLERSACEGGSELVEVFGWSKTVRRAGGGRFAFVELNDGSTVKNIQIMVDSKMPEFETVATSAVSCSFRFKGSLVESPGKGQRWEIQVNDPSIGHTVHKYGDADPLKYPLAKKQHGLDYIRSIVHLRSRTYVMGAVTRIRSALSMATHTFFHDRGFLYIHTPIITGADCEGAGEMFEVTAGDNNQPPPTPKREQPSELDTATLSDVPAKAVSTAPSHFFGKPVSLTVSGQLAVEPYCCSLGDVYTFGPTFRAENSHTTRHLAEFWMIEPEVAWGDKETLMRLAEEYLRFSVKWVVEKCSDDVAYLEKAGHVKLDALNGIVKNDFARVSYTEAIELLKVCKERETFRQPNITWGMDLGSEHERWLCERHFKKPAIVHDYPFSLKAFYMKRDLEQKTCQAIDCLVPDIGEIIGGSVREERLDVLAQSIQEKSLAVENYKWYLELREFGTIPHCGFGLGFERLVMLCTGMENIRDVIPYPRYPGSAEG